MQVCLCVGTHRTGFRRPAIVGLYTTAKARAHAHKHTYTYLMAVFVQTLRNVSTGRRGICCCCCCCMPCIIHLYMLIKLHAKVRQRRRRCSNRHARGHTERSYGTSPRVCDDVLTAAAAGTAESGDSDAHEQLENASRENVVFLALTPLRRQRLVYRILACTRAIRVLIKYLFISL